ncbi:MAG: DNA alkylation repair protein [Oscillospiraceae bacterium]|nr:DNA alkylation repair protein [Oscillospiraceae bacterium]
MIREKLFALKDTKYAEFHARLIPSVASECIIGVRVPQLRLLARQLYKERVYANFLDELPHTYYDENMLHGLIISEIKDYDTCIAEIEQFLPFVNNWAVCDTMSPGVFKTHKEPLIEKIRIWSQSSHVYTCRFGLKILMSHYLDNDFLPEYLEIPAAIHSEEYYVNMMIAWFFATALAKQWDTALPYLEQNRLDLWTHNKTIQKAKESFRITEEQKLLLNSLKRSTSE